MQKLSLIKKYLSNYSHLPKECWQSAFLTFIESLATGICFFLSLYFINILHISIAEAGFLTSSYGLGTICGGFLSGKLSDYLPAKRISTVSLLIQSIAFLFLTQLTNKNALLVTMFIIGFCTYGFITANNIWIFKQCHNQPAMRLKSINIIRAASNLGMGVAGIIIGFLKVQQFHVLFYFSSILLLSCASYFHYCVIDKELPKQNNSDQKSLLNSQEYYNRNKKIIFLMLNCLFLVSLIISQLSITYPIYIQESFPLMGTHAISILFTLDTLLIVLLQAPLINCLKEFNKVILVGIGAFLMGLGMFLLNFSIFFYIAIISCIIWTTGEIIFLGIAQFLCYEAGKEKKKGQIIGIFQAVSATGRIIGPIIGGYIYYYAGGHALWSLSMIIGIYCMLLCLCFRDSDFIQC